MAPGTSKKTLVYQNLEYKVWKEEREEAKSCKIALSGIEAYERQPQPTAPSPARWSMEHTPRKSISDNKLWRLHDHTLPPGLPAKPEASPPRQGALLPPPTSFGYVRSSKDYTPTRASSSVTLARFSSQSPPTLTLTQPPGLGPKPAAYLPMAPQQYMYAASPQPYAFVQPMYVPVPAPVWPTYQSQDPSAGAYLTGSLKFFDEIQQYGFFVLDTDGSDLFVHYDDLLKSGITLNTLQEAKVYDYKFAFQCITYYGKYSLSRKAVNVRIISVAKSSENKSVAFADYASKASGI